MSEIGGPEEPMPLEMLLDDAYLTLRDLVKVGQPPKSCEARPFPPRPGNCTETFSKRQLGTLAALKFAKQKRYSSSN